MIISYWVNLAHHKAYKQAVDDGQNYYHFDYGEFLGNMGPYILKLAKVIKYAAPVAGAAAGACERPIGAVMGAKYAKDLASQIKLMEELARK